MKKSRAFPTDLSKGIYPSSAVRTVLASATSQHSAFNLRYLGDITNDRLQVRIVAQGCDPKNYEMSRRLELKHSINSWYNM